MNIENGHGDMACADVAAALVLAADDELTDVELGVVERHLAKCAACRLEWSTVARMDAWLRECRAEINAQSPPDPAVRVRLVDAVRSRERGRWQFRWPEQGKWGWVGAAAGLCIAAMAAWMILVPENLGRHRTEQPAVAPVTAEVIRVKVTLAPVGDPFLDGSPAESQVLADVAVGADGQPRDIRLAE